MAKKKREHFEEMKTMSCAIEPDNEAMMQGDFHLKGKWNSEVFKNDNPITLELGCGKGEYTIALARKYPQRNFIGIDIKGARLWRGCRTATDEGLRNVAFLRIKIEFIENFFSVAEVEHIWLTFSDPQPKDRKGTKRINSPVFLERYARILKPGGEVHVKTDSPLLYQSSLDVIAKGHHQVIFTTDNLYSADFANLDQDQKDILTVKTFYEEKFLGAGLPIHYVRFALNHEAFKDI